MSKNFPKGLLGGGVTAKLVREERVCSFSCCLHKGSHGLQHSVLFPTTYAAPLFGGEDLWAHCGERQRLCPSWDMAARCDELRCSPEAEDLDQAAPALFWGYWLFTFLIQRRKRHEPNSSGISTCKSIFMFLLDTAQSCQSWQTWQVLIRRLAEMCP